MISIFFLKQWLISLVVGPLKKNSKISISIKPKAGIPQSSIIGRGICNLGLDVIDDLLLDYNGMINYLQNPF